MNDFLMDWSPLTLILLGALLAFLWLSRDPLDEDKELPLELEER